MTEDKKYQRDDETIEKVPLSGFKIIQKKKGYRYSLDAFLLSNFVEVRRGDRILELGTGCGIIAFLLYSRLEEGFITAIDVQESMIDMAKRSALINSVNSSLKFMCGDCRKIDTLIQPGSFDRVVFNPPYRRLKSGRISHLSEKARARHEIDGTVDDFLKAASYALVHGGKVYLIYSARRMVEAICRMRERHLEPKRVRVVYSYPGGDAEFILLEGIKGGGEELRFLPPLYIYTEREGRYTNEVLSMIGWTTLSNGGG
ncbi:MAG: methyltransferase [Syntrophales bacterium]|nr:methyltransferase [Syntrophales bacterium]